VLKATVILFDTRIPEKDFLFYYVPKELENKISVGKGVIVPLKRRRVLGYVWNLNYYNSTDDLSLNIKPIISVVDKFPSLPESLIKVVNWISEYYENSLYKSANYIFPSGVELKIKRKLKAIDNFNGDLTKKQREIFEQLKEEKILKKGISENIIRNLIKKGAIEEDIDVEISE
jgi:primosomal protein N' (replication factor Y)